jgi:hypothetical protein
MEGGKGREKDETIYEVVSNSCKDAGTTGSNYHVRVRAGISLNHLTSHYASQPKWVVGQNLK